MDVSNLKRVFPSPGREQYLELGMSEPSAAGESSNNKSPSENSAAAPDEKASSEETMSADGEIFKAEVVYIKDWEEGGAGNNVVKRRETEVKLHKIKFSYKSLAAIPTNTLLQDQQTIDEQVEREDLHDSLEMDEDTHVQMCSSAQLRQQSEELYAVIDGVLEDSVPKCQTSHVPRLSRELANKGVPQPHASPPRFLGHETKYALCSLSPPAPVERKLMDSYKTKPGCIRPMSATPRLTVEDNDGEHRANPFRQYLQLSATDNKKSLVEAGGDAGVNPEGQQLSKVCPETASTFSMHNSLLITEPQDRNTL